MTKTTGELDYDERAALHLPESAQDNPYAGCELHVIGRAAEEPDDEDTPGEAAARRNRATRRTRRNWRTRATRRRRPCWPRGVSARSCARAAVWTRKRASGRSVYSDFAVLLRSHRYAAEVWAQTFSKMGVPVYVQLTGGYFDAIEVQVFLNLLRVIDNRRQDIPLLSVLRSPVFGFSVEELVALRTEEYRGETLFERLLECADGLTALSGRARETLNALETWRRERAAGAADGVLSQLLDDTGFTIA
jgi:ATP-dependent helicase/nuclease subunit A